jgi:light-regulated signal transduction histidine kinase (bacteriophytochrome)
MSDPAPPFFIADCASEPIHRLGFVQRFGVLLVMDADWNIIAASDNAPEILHCSAESLLRQPLRNLLGDAQWAALLEHLSSHEPDFPYLTNIMLIGTGSSAPFSLTVHINEDGHYLIELEPASNSARRAYLDFYNAGNQAITHIRHASELTELCQVAAHELRSIIGYDRVMVYRFDEEHNGEVVAEARAEGVEPFLGLRYPASDIPPLARQLFFRNRIRMIPDVEAPHASLLSAVPMAQPPDLAPVTLRGSSLAHLVYLKNMGTRASFVIAIIKGDELWGLFACHHLSPRYLPKETRLLCDLLGSVFSAQITVLDEKQHMEHQTQLQSRLRRIISDMQKPPSLVEAFTERIESLCRAFGASGGALVAGDLCHMAGVVPPMPFLLELIGWLSACRPEDGIFATHRLYRDFAPAEAVIETASGLLAISMHFETPLHVLFFRPEIVQTVTWGSARDKQLLIRGDKMELTPAQSFRAWKELVRGQSEPWTRAELEGADDLRMWMVDVQLRRAIIESEERLRNVLGMMPTLVLVADENRLIYVNPAVEALFGYDLAVTEAILRDRIMPYGTHLQPYEVALPVKAGEERWFYMTNLTTEMAGMQVMVYIGLDATERKFANEQANLLEREREQMQILADFIQDASHDLRTPLSVINTSLHLLRRQAHDSLWPRINKIEEQTVYLNRVIEGMFTMLKLDQDSEQRFVPLQMRTLLETAPGHFQQMLENKQQVIRLELSPRVLHVRGSEVELTRCIGNLMENAIKYSPNQSIIHLREYQEGEMVVIEVNNTGPLIEAEDLPHLFERFYRADKARSTSGTGLGLAIVKKIVDKHGGTVEVESTAEAGNTFRVRLPLLKDELPSTES